MNDAVNLQSVHIIKTKKKYIFDWKRCRYAVPARTVTKLTGENIACFGDNVADGQTSGTLELHASRQCKCC